MSIATEELWSAAILLMFLALLAIQLNAHIPSSRPEVRGSYHLVALILAVTAAVLSFVYLWRVLTG